MGAQLTRLRIAGFKSFAEPVSLDILPGLTGIVGPNGCGKSNVVEALRWAMGETSARSLRGGEMDDVIFAGSTARASRNLAEVTITLAPGDGTAGEHGALPAPFEAEAEVQLTRRIERGAGSQFRANGREMRARDVQTFYADLASGARSSGMVSQGRVAALVGARPEERRQVLEEAAGITGLHARRHEAELKLKAAEQNVARAEDLRVQLETNREGLRRQARQAARYRNISGLIRGAEAEHLAILHAAAQAALQQAQSAHEAARARAEEAAAEVVTAAGAMADAEAALPEPREAEAQAARLLERRRMEAETLAAEAVRAARDAADAETRLVELETDLAAAIRAGADAEASVTRLSADVGRLSARMAALPAALEAASAGRDAAGQAMRAAQGLADSAADAARDAEFAAVQAKEALRAALARRDRAQAEHAAALADHTLCKAALVDTERLEAAATAVLQAAASRDAVHLAVEQAELARAAAASAHADAMARQDQARLARVTAERAVRQAQARADQMRAACDQAAAALHALAERRIAPEALAAIRAAASEAQARAEDAEIRLETQERETSDALASRAEMQRQAESHASAIAAAEAALATARARAEAIDREAASTRAAWDEAMRAGPEAAEIAAAKAALSAAEQALSRQDDAVRRLGEGRARAAQALEAARAATAAWQAEAARQAAEAAGLAASIGGQAESGESDAACILSAITLEEGLEAALGAALGEAAEASLNEAAPRFWRHLPSPDTIPALPEGSIPLSRLIQAPAELQRALAHIALIDEAVDGCDLQPTLAPGITLVSRTGACWRWDGHVTRAGAPNPAATRLAQRRRLAQAEAALDQARAAADAAAAQSEAAERDASAAIAWEDSSRAALTEAEARLRANRAAAEALAAQAAQAEARRAALAPILQRLELESQAARKALSEAQQHLRHLPSPEHATQTLEAAIRHAEACAQTLESARASRQAARAAHSEAQARFASLAAAAQEIEARIAAETPALARARQDYEMSARQLAAALDDQAALPPPEGIAASVAAAAQAETRARAGEQQARDQRREAEVALERARAEQAALRAAHAQAASRHEAATLMLERSQADLHAAHTQLDQAEQTLAALPALDTLTQAAQSARQELEAAREAVAATEHMATTLHAERHQAESALELAGQELAAWQARRDDAAARIQGLQARRDAARAAHHAIGDAPAELAARAARSGAALASAEAAHGAAQAKLQAADRRVRALALAQRDAEQALASCRESLVRGEAAREAAAGALAAVLARAAERLGTEHALPAQEDISDAAEERARKKFERLAREREEMGPVNLRAELELEELDQRLATLDREREELGTAIAKLRGAIGHLNREGRTRLEAVFTQVDQHFRTLFTRMMGGGRAHLALTGSEDPLQAGLEIYAEPPGKKLAALSLLSGGEQALTALSLIFAVFRCTPSPISVLDEVDAPLDDANVERFCTLLDDVVRDTGTRFLVVTHHQLTMSRMDRLFGVTMQERGVSRLLSVDFQRAMEMVELKAAE